MVKTLKSISKYYTRFGCFYCGVDSTQLKIFLFSLFGSLILGTVFLGVGMVLKGKFKDSETLKFLVLEAEDKEIL